MGCGLLRGMWDWLWFSCGIARRGGLLVAMFQGSFASAGEVFILPGGWALGYHSMGFGHFPNI